MPIGRFWRRWREEEEGEERRGASEVDMRRRQERRGNIIMSPVAVRIWYGRD